MIRIKYIPNILDKEGRQEISLDYNRDITLKEYLAASGFVYEDHRIIVSGVLVADLNERLDNDDEVIITPSVEDVISAVIAIVSFIVENWAVIATVLTIASIGYSIYQAVSYKKPSMPNFNSNGADGLDESSPTYGWEGIQTRQDVGLAIAICYGRHKLGGNIINAYISNDGENNYLNVLLGLCEGEVEDISDIKINNQPIANFSGCSYTTKSGTNSDTVIPNFEDLHSVNDIGQALNTNGSSHTYTTVLTNVEGFEVRLKFPAGLFLQNSSDGAIQNWQVGYKIEYKLHAAGTWTTLGTYTADAKTRTELRKYHTQTGLSAGQYDIRVTRITDASDFYHTGDLTLVSIDEIRTADLAYPNLAKIGIKALATDQLSGGMPQFSCIVKGRKIKTPNVTYGGSPLVYDNYYYDPATSQYKRFSDNAVCSWPGDYVTAYSANPIWCLYDLLTNGRLGLGEYINTSLITDSEWVAMSQYCDERVADGNGGYEKRFRMDIVIDSGARALDILQQIASCFRGIIFYSGGYIKIVIDKEASPVQLFGMGNIVAGSLKMSWRSKKEAVNVVDVQFMDLDKDYQQEQISVVDEAAISAGDPLRKKQIKVFCTRTSQAIREGQYQLNASKYVTRSVNFKADIEAIACQVGDTISLSHDVPQWGFSGRVQAGSTTTKVKLDRSITIEAGKTYKIRMKFADDTIEEKTISDAAGTYTEVNVSSAFSQAPAAYDVYAFGENNKVKKDFRVIQMRRDNDNHIDITAIEYNASIYDTDTIALPTDNVSALSLEIPDVTNLVLTERIVKLADGTIENVIDVWFNRPALASYQVNVYHKAKVYVSENSGTTWVLRGETLGTHFAIQGGLVDLSTYRVAVVSVTESSQSNAIGDSPYADIQILGKHLPPEDVDGFSVRQDGDEIVFSWSPNPDIDLFGYEIRIGDTWETGEVIETDIQHTTYRIPVFLFGLQEYHIKAIDTSRNYSINSASATLTISSANLIEDKGDYALDSWATGILDLSDANSYDLVDESGNIVTDESDNQVVGSPLVGFEIDTNIDSEQITDESGNYLTDESDNLITEDLDYPDLLATKLFGDTYASEGIYISPVTDLGIKMNARIMVTTNVQGNCSYALYISTSDDNISWSVWNAYAVGEYACRYFKIKLVLTNSDASQVCYVLNLSAYVTGQLIFEGFKDISIAAGGTNIVFTKTFYTLVRVFIVAQGANRRAVYGSKSLTQVTGVKVLDNSDADVGGIVDCLVQGY